jgi:hypothetical protein
MTLYKMEQVHFDSTIYVDALILLYVLNYLSEFCNMLRTPERMIERVRNY